MAKTKKEKELQQIEDRLSIYLATDRKTWADTYLLMRQVRDEKLYAPQYASFTQWVNDLAVKNHYHQSTLWSRFTAGMTYEEYAERKKKAGENPPAMKEVNISPDSISLIHTIASRSKNPKYADDLMDKALSHTLSRQDLREVNRKIRAKHTKGRQSVDPDLKKIEVKNKISVTADMIVEAFKTSSDWLPTPYRHGRNSFYQVYPELPVKSGTSHYARRMDECIFENMTHEHAQANKVSIHCIENKVSKNDLVKDRKMGEYAPYGDYFWLCVPPELIDIAKSYIAQGWGILSVNKNKEINVIVRAKKHECLFREETLTEALTHSVPMSKDTLAC